MGQKVNPKGIRLGITNTWGSKWFAHKQDYIPQLRQDLAIRKYLMKKLKDAGIAQADIERGPGKLTINVHVVKPGLVIGKAGAGIDEIKQELQTKILNKEKTAVSGKTELAINVKEIDNPNLNAQVVMDSMIADLERRVPYRRVLKQALQRVERAGAKGVKVLVAGRLNGADIARTEMLSSGQLPLQTLRADIDYTRGAATTMYGQIGIKVWIYKGEVFNKKNSGGKNQAAGTVVKSKKQPAE